MIPLGLYGAARPVASIEWSPLDLPGLWGWWDASDEATITESGGTVSAIADKSGNARHLIATGSPTITTINGVPAVAVTATSDYLVTSELGGASGVQPVVSAGVVQKYTALSNFNHLVTPFQWRVLYHNTTVWTSYGGAGGAIASTVARDTNPHYATAVRNGSSSRFRIDGAGEWTGTLEANSNNHPVRVGGSGVTGIFGELAVCIGALSTSDLESFETYVAAKWGL